MKKASIYIKTVAAVLLGLSLASCNEELAEAPAILPEGGIGTGMWDNPMTAYQAHIGSINPDKNPAWVKGYIVGLVNVDISNTLSTACAQYAPPFGVNTNILISDTPVDVEMVDNMTPEEQKAFLEEFVSTVTTVQLPYGSARNALNLSDHPENLGKMVTIKGTTGSKYCSVYGVRDVYEYNWGDIGIEEVEPVVPEGTIYQSLLWDATSCDWRFNNIELASGLSSVWSWTSRNGGYYLYGTAYSNGQSYAAISYAVSPTISLKDVTGAEVEFEHAANYQRNIKQLCRFVAREVGGQWVELDIPVWPTAGTWDFANSGRIDLSQFAGKDIQLGFKYESTSSNADSWEIRNLYIIKK